MNKPAEAPLPIAAVEIDAAAARTALGSQTPPIEAPGRWFLVARASGAARAWDDRAHALKGALSRLRGFAVLVEAGATLDAAQRQRVAAELRSAVDLLGAEAQLLLAMFDGA